ncbi:MAG: hypothetical protein ACRDRA_05450 [Pseudonocardiaceae bacterium]
MLLARELPHLRMLLHSEPESLRRPDAADPALGRRVLTLVQGHPELLELADAATAAADPARLASRLAAAEAAVDGAALSAFLRDAAAPSRLLRQAVSTAKQRFANYISAAHRLCPRQDSNLQHTV